jgi:thiosulfate/3-mercaptopyruvate sulfurtransferase
MSENKGYIYPESLVDTEWVQAHLTDPEVRLIEVDVDTTAYEQGHIPGAVGFNWQKERSHSSSNGRKPSTLISGLPRPMPQRSLRSVSGWMGFPWPLNWRQPVPNSCHLKNCLGVWKTQVNAVFYQDGGQRASYSPEKLMARQAESPYQTEFA